MRRDHVAPTLRYLTLAVLIASVPVTLSVLTARGETESGIPPALRPILVLAMVEWHPWAFVAPFIDRLIRRSHPRRRTDYLRIAAYHAGLLVAFGLVHRTAVFLTAAATFPGERRAWSQAALVQMVPEAIVYMAVAIGFTIAESRRRQTELAERLKAEVAEARLDALRQQLNPHFLFNTLNHVVMQLREGAVEPATRMVLALSDLLRDVLHDRGQMITLAEELRIIERYLEIGRERFGDRLHAQLTVDPRALTARVPTLILQPLVENAMRHGLDALGHCRLSLSARVQDGRLRIDIRDQGPGLPSATTNAPGIGLRNTADRLQFMYGHDHRFALQPAEGGGLLVSLELPLQR